MGHAVDISKTHRHTVLAHSSAVNQQTSGKAVNKPIFSRYPLYRRLGGPQGRSGQVRKISPPPGFDTRVVQPVASRYTD